jgi:hypothetical protein
MNPQSYSAARAILAASPASAHASASLAGERARRRYRASSLGLGSDPILREETCLTFTARLWLRTALVVWAGWLGLLGLLLVRA